MFSSKHEGLAGTRFGWGLYRDATLAQSVANVVDALVLGVSIDVELRVLAALQAILGNTVHSCHSVFVVHIPSLHNTCSMMGPCLTTLLKYQESQQQNYVDYVLHTRVSHSKLQGIFSYIICVFKVIIYMCI